MTRKEFLRSMERIHRSLEEAEHEISNLQDEIEDDDAYDDFESSKDGIVEAMVELKKISSSYESGELENEFEWGEFIWKMTPQIYSQTSFLHIIPG